MRIIELNGREEVEGEQDPANGDKRLVMPGDAKRKLVGVYARLLFYPTLAYNVVRNKVDSGFHWWDEIDQFLLLGAVPFPSHIPRLKRLGIHGVITLNEPYETLVPSSMYNEHGIEHLVIPTRDYLFAPSFGDIRTAVDFINRNASSGKTTYVHCKAGRGRSTTVVLCYLVQHKQMTPNAAYEYVRLRRPRVSLAVSQWKAVQEYYFLSTNDHERCIRSDKPVIASPLILSTCNVISFDDSSFVLVSKSDLDDCVGEVELANVGNSIWADVGLVYRVQFAGKAAFASLTRFGLWCHVRQQRVLCGAFGAESCSLTAAEKLGRCHPSLLEGLVV